MRIVVISKRNQPDVEMLKLIEPRPGCLEKFQMTYRPDDGYTYTEKHIKHIPNNNTGEADAILRAKWTGRPDMSKITLRR